MCAAREARSGELATQATQIYSWMWIRPQPAENRFFWPRKCQGTRNKGDYGNFGDLQAGRKKVVGRGMKANASFLVRVCLAAADWMGASAERAVTRFGVHLQQSLEVPRNCGVAAPERPSAHQC